MALGWATGAGAQVRAFDLPAQPALAAIPEFARQAGVQIIAPADALTSATSPVVQGRYEVRQALERLISRSGLEVASHDGRTIVLRRRARTATDAVHAEPETPPQLAAAVLVDPLVVFGRGAARQLQRVSGGELVYRPPGSSPLRLLDTLPSVELTSGDPFAMNEESTRIAVRNFVQGRLGFTLDDIPLGDMTGDGHNGLHVSRAITAENIAYVELSQGPGSLDGASASNLGGTIKFVSRDPGGEPAALLTLAGGEAATARGLLRLETGELASGLRAAASYVYSTTEKWQGEGRQHLAQVNLKAVQPLAAHGALTVFADLSRRRDSDPQDLSLEMLGRLGPGWDNISDDWPLAVRIAEIANNRGDTGVPAQRPGLGSSFPAPITSVDDAYFDAASARDDALAAVTLRWPVGEHMRLKAIAYGHLGRGQALIWTPRAPSPNYGQAGAAGDDAPISIRGTEYDIDRRGVLASVAGDAGRHRISVGLWLEENRFDQARRFYALDLDAPGRSYDDFQKDAFLTEWDYRFVTRTRQAYVQDTWSVGEALTLSAGFKALSVESRAATRAGPRKAGSITASNPLLPQFGLRYRIGPDLEVFGDYGRGMRAFAAANTTGPFATTREAFDAIKSQLKPEISDSVEVGVRRTNDDVTLLAAVYAVRFRDRLFSTPVGQGILGNPLTIANVGSVTATGAEAAGVWRFAPGWSAYASYAYSRAAYDDDVFDGDGRLIGRTRDKQVVDAPAHIGKAHLDYRGEALFGRLGLTYLGERFFTFENDQRVPSHLTADLTLGWRFGDAGWRKGLEAQLNVTNLFDVRYVATLGGNDFPVRGDAQTLLAGPPRQVFFALRRSF